MKPTNTFSLGLYKMKQTINYNSQRQKQTIFKPQTPKPQSSSNFMDKIIVYTKLQKKKNYETETSCPYPEKI